MWRQVGADRAQALAELIDEPKDPCGRRGVVVLTHPQEQLLLLTCGEAATHDDPLAHPPGGVCADEVGRDPHRDLLLAGGEVGEESVRAGAGRAGSHLGCQAHVDAGVGTGEIGGCLGHVCPVGDLGPPCSPGGEGDGAAQCRGKARPPAPVGPVPGSTPGPAQAHEPGGRYCREEGGGERGLHCDEARRPRSDGPGGEPEIQGRARPRGGAHTVTSACNWPMSAGPIPGTACRSSISANSPCSSR